MTPRVELERAAWRDRDASAYHAAIRNLFEEAAALPDPARRAEAVLALADAVLGREEPPVDAVGEAARGLAMLLDGADPAVIEGACARLAAAWRRLRSVAKAAPDRIAVRPDLPTGAALPHGADPAGIDDPALRREAAAAQAVHREAAERWNAGQAALAWIRELGAMLPPEVGRRIEQQAG